MIARRFAPIAVTAVVLGLLGTPLAGALPDEGDDGAKEGAAVNGLKVKLEATKGAAKKAEEIGLRATFENVGGKDVSLTFWWSRFLRVTDAKGNVVTAGAGPTLPSGMAEEPVVLAPGKTYERAEYFGCTQPAGAPKGIGWSYALPPGRYTVVLVYEVPRAHGFGQNARADGWRGKIESNPVEITIE